MANYKKEINKPRLCFQNGQNRKQRVDSTLSGCCYRSWESFSNVGICIDFETWKKIVPVSFCLPDMAINQANVELKI